MRFIKVKGGVMDLNKNPYIKVRDGRAIEIRTTLSGMTYEADLGVIENESDDVVMLLNDMMLEIQKNMLDEINKLKNDIKRGLI